MSREKMDVILKGIVKHFFIEKEVTSTLVMDSLYSGLKALEGQSKSKKARARSLDAKEYPAPIVSVDKDMFVLVDDVLLLLERAALEPLPPKENKAPQNRTKVGFMRCIYIYIYFFFWGRNSVLCDCICIRFILFFVVCPFSSFRGLVALSTRKLHVVK